MTEPLLTSKQAAELLGVCERTLANLRARKKLAYQKVGKCVRYRRCDLDAAIQKMTVKAI